MTVPPVLARAGPLAPALVLVALAPLAGCSTGPPVPYQATVSTCYAFAVQALDRHVTVTSVPRACAGLTHQQINLVVERAVRDVVGPRPKAEGRPRTWPGRWPSGRVATAGRQSRALGRRRAGP